MVNTNSNIVGSTYRTEISITRLIDNKIVPAKLELMFDLEFDDSKDAQKQTLAIAKIRRWFDSCLRDCLALPINDSLNIELFSSIGNTLMFCPDEPHDFLLLLLIHAKINAIGNGVVEVSHSELMSDTSDGFGSWFEGQPTDLLPSIDEWLGKRTFFNAAWWNRSDGGMIDVFASDDDDITIKPNILIDLDSDLDDIIFKLEPAEIITPNFKPTIIKND